MAKPTALQKRPHGRIVIVDTPEARFIGALFSGASDKELEKIRKEATKARKAQTKGRK